MKSGFGFRQMISGGRGRWWLLGLLLGLLAGPARADHLIGYDWSLAPLGAGTFRVQLRLYLDPAASPPASNGDPSVTIAAYERGNTARLVGTFTLPRAGTGALTGGTPGCDVTNAEIRMVVYEQTIALPAVQYGSPNGYWLTWERCCRNANVTNLRSPTAEGMAMLVAFPPVGNGPPNSTPTFTRLPSAQALCVGDPTTVSFAASDPDGDSLAYALTPALAGFTSQSVALLSVPNAPPYPAVGYVGGFSGQQPLPGTFTLDPLTGQLSGTALRPGIFAVAVVVEEWRRGQKIGENRREIQLTVRSCPRNQPPRLSTLPGTPDTLRLDPANACLSLAVTDADPGQNLTVRAVGTPPVVITPAVLPSGAGTVTVCWPGCPPPGEQQLTLVVTDNGCPVLTDTLRVPVRIGPGLPNNPPRIARVPTGATDTLTVRIGETLTFELAANDADNEPLRVQAVTAPVGLTVAPDQGTGAVRAVVRWAVPCEAAPGEYALRFRVRDGRCGAADSVLVPVRVAAPGAGALPAPASVITPNDDGLNDCLSLPLVPPAGPCAGGFGGIEIYNRWGQRVYASADPGFCWDAADVPAGTYFARIIWNRQVWRTLVTVIK